ncbi:bactericidal permeability-increasing protein-like [Clytia hemisphaerica]|uniref:Bactericidal permeability-increasing protein n=1 Tax=Clytia hemisphaerica TaxID=252671 RepID=A0A7M5X095_9CNID|eukprot:TCONS_00015445-protein
MKLVLLLSICIAAALTADQIYAVPRGAQVRLTHRGMSYSASIGVKKLQQELTNKRLPTASGGSGGFSYSASNLLLRTVRVGGYNVQPVAGNGGLSLSMSGIYVSASARIQVKYQKGWVKLSDTRNVDIKTSGVGFTLRINIGAQSGKPQLNVASCSASIGDIDLDFSGNLGFLFNGIAKLFEGKIKDILRKVICDEGRKLVNNEANGFLRGFPVQQNIENYAIINYAFQSPISTSSYIDFLLRGEFLDPKNPVHSKVTPPTFDTVTSSAKMAYVWITDYTLNTAGDVFHKTGLLKKLVGPLTKEIPKDVKPFLNTKSFEKFIPELFKRFPNRPLEFEIQTNKAPSFSISPGNIGISIDVRVKVVVDKVDGSKLPVFYLDLTVDAKGSVFVKSVNKQLNVGGNIVDFTFGLSVGGSVIGEVNLPIDDPSVKMLVKGLIIENANPLLNKGFPIPKVDDLDFINPQVSFVKNAIRVDTDINYSG